MSTSYLSADDLRSQASQMSAKVRREEAATPDLADVFRIHRSLKEIQGADHNELADDLMASRRALTKQTNEILKAISPAATEQAARDGVAVGVYMFDIEEVVDLMRAEIDQLETRYSAAKKILSDLGVDAYHDEDGEQMQSSCSC